MEILYYKVHKSSTLGQLIAAVMERVQLCDSEADGLAKEVGAYAYLPSSLSDYGGIDAFAFSKNKLVNQRIWKPISVEGMEDTYYVPAVLVTTKVVLEKDRHLYDKKNQIVSGNTVPFSSVSIMFSREEAAAMAGIALTTQPIERLAKKYGVDRKTVCMLRWGASADALLPDMDEDVRTAFRLSALEETQVLDRLKKERFYSVMVLDGEPVAVEIYRKMMSLPTVPAHTVNGLLGVESQEIRCGILDKEEFYYVSSPEEIDKGDVIPSCESEFSDSLIE